MPVRIACPNCKAAVNLADEHLGKTLRCKGCQKLFKAPQPAAAKPPAPIRPSPPPPQPEVLQVEDILDDDDDDDAEEVVPVPSDRSGSRNPLGPPASARRSSTPRKKGGVGVVLAVVGLAVLLGCGVLGGGGALVLWLMGSKPNPPPMAGNPRGAPVVPGDRGPAVNPDPFPHDDFKPGPNPPGGPGMGPGDGFAPGFGPGQGPRPPGPGEGLGGFPGPGRGPGADPAPAPAFVPPPPPPPPAGIKPAPLQGDKAVVTLPAAADDVCVGGGGRYLILRLPQQRKLAVFDTNEAKVVKYLPISEDSARIAAGMDKLIVALPTTNVLQRWSLTTFEREVAVPSPLQGTIANVVMGSASAGPLFVSLTNGDQFAREGSAAFVDSMTFKRIEMRWNQAGMPGNAAELVRASPDGTLFGMRTSMGSEGHDMALITLYGNQAQVRNGGMGASLMLPSPDARAIYTSEGVFTTRLDKVYPAAGERNAAPPLFVPARHGDIFMQLEPAGERFGIPGENANLTGSVAFLLPGQYRPFATLRDVEGVAHENLAYGGNPANKMHHDKRVHLIPDAKLLVTIPSTNDRLVLRRFDLDDLLAKSGVDYLLVTSQPPASFKPGATFTYPVAVKSKKGGVKYKLESGPDGMKVAADGKLTWKVPAGFAAAEVDVILTVADSSGQEIFQTFKIGRNDNADAAPPVEGAGAAPPPAEVKPPRDEVKPAEVELPAARQGNPAGGLKPAPLQANREERALPSPAGEVCAGGGGRFIILHLPREHKLAVFDASEGKVVKYIPAAEDNLKIAACLDKLIVVLPSANVVQRWSLETFERDVAAPSPVGGPIDLALMGSASRGPLVLFGKDGPTLLDPYTFKKLPNQGPTNNWGGHESAWRISGDGRVLTSYQPGLSPQGHAIHHRTDKGFKQAGIAADHNFAGLMAPGMEGRFVYTARGVFTSEGKPVGKLGNYGDGTRYCLPAAEGEAFYLRIDVPGFPHGDDKKAGKLYLHLAGDDRPLAELKDVEVPKGLNTWGREPFGTDRRFYLVPSAKLLAVLPTTQDRLVLYKVDVEELLAKSDHDYLVVLSRPPEEAVRGKTLSYAPVVKSRKGGMKMKLESGPDGLKLGPDGTVTWDVPKDLADKEVSVILSVSDAAGQEAFHTFKMAVKDGADAAPEKGRPAGKVEPPE